MSGVVVLLGSAGAAILITGAAADHSAAPSADGTHRPLPSALARRSQPTPAPAPEAVPTTPPTPPQSTPGDTDPGGSPPPAPPTNPPTTTGPATVLRRHLVQLGDGRYDAAFALMTPAYRRRNPRWPELRADAAPVARITHVGAASISGDDADVQVRFYARDTRAVPGSDTQCRRFTGTAHLRRIDGRWRYDPRDGALTAAILPAGNSQCP